MRKMDVRQAVQSPSGGLPGALGRALAALIGVPGGPEGAGGGSGADLERKNEKSLNFWGPSWRQFGSKICDFRGWKRNLK